MSASNWHMQYAWTHVHSVPAAEINRRLKWEVCHIDPCSSSQQCNYKRTSPYEVCEWDDRISLCMCISAWVREDVFAFVLWKGCFYFLNALLLNVHAECVSLCPLWEDQPSLHTSGHKGRRTIQVLCVSVHKYISSIYLLSKLYMPFCNLVSINLPVAMRSDPRMLSGCQVLLPFTLGCTPTHACLLVSSFHRRPAFFNTFLFALTGCQLNGNDSHFESIKTDERMWEM